MTPTTESLALPRSLQPLFRSIAHALAALRHWCSKQRMRPAASLDELSTHLLRDINLQGGTHGRMRERGELASYDRAHAGRRFEHNL